VNLVKAQLKLVCTYLVGLAGLLFATAGCALSNTAIERSMQSDSSRSLSWGPTLFRVLLVVHGLALIIAAARLVKTWARKTPRTNKATLNWYPWAVLIALSLVAFALRMWRLNTDLWYDELVTLLNFVRMPLGDILTRLPDQNNHILFSVLSHASVSIFGESPWAVRLPSVIFGVASIWALFLLGRRMVSTVEALAACALMTFSYHHIWFSQNARGYMALLFFSVLATWL